VAKPGSSDPSQEQLGIAKSMLSITQQMATAIDSVNKKQIEQVQIMGQIHDSMKSLDTQSLVSSLDKVVKAVNELTKKIQEMGKTSQQALQDMNEEALEANESMGSLNDTVNQAAEAAEKSASKSGELTTALKKNDEVVLSLSDRWKNFTEELKVRFPKSAVFAAGALDGLMSSLSAVGAGFKLLKGTISTVVDSILEIGKAIISIPFEFLDDLAGKANELAGQTSEWFDALQEIKREYGNLQQTSSKAVVSMARDTKSLAQAGIDSFKIFGTDAEAARTFLSMAQGMGPVFNQLSAEIKSAGQAFPAIQMGLGLTNEDMRALGSVAIATGQDLNSVTTSVHKQSRAMSKAFGVDSKHIARDMAKAMGDVKNFAGATIKQIGVAATYAQKLGVELDKITGTLGAFETFEGAAENASKLSQAFGVNIDAFKMMEAQDPASQVDMLRKSFAAAGKDAEKMNRQELNLLATSVGMDEATARQVFALKNQGIALDQITQKGEEAEKAQIDQTTVLRELKDALVEMQKPFSAQGGFFKQFIDGVTQGFERTDEFRDLLKNMGGSLKVFREEGRRLGKTIMDMFPGIKQLFGGLKDMFEPSKFRKLTGGIVDVIKDFFKEVSTGRFSFSELMKRIKEKFLDFFNSQGESGKNVLNGFKTFFKAVSGIVASAIKWMSEMVRDGIVTIVDLISGKKKLSDGGAGSFLANALAPIGEAFLYAWENLKPVMWDALKSLGDSILDWASDTLLPKLKQLAPILLGALFGAAALKGILSVVTAQIGAHFSGGIGKLLGGGKKTADAAAPAAAIDSGAAAQVTQASEKVGQDSGGVDNVSYVIGKINEVMQKEKESGWDAAAAKKLGLKLIAIAAAIAVGGVLVAGAIKLMIEIIGDAGAGKILAAAGILAAMGMAGAMFGELYDKIKDISWGKLLLILPSLALGILALGAAGAAIVKMLSGFTIEQIGTAALIMAPMTAIAIAFGGMYDKIKDISWGALLGILPSLALGIYLLGLAGSKIVEMVKDYKIEEIGVAAALIGAMTLAAGALGLMMENVKDVDWKTMAGALVGVTLAIAALSFVGYALLQSVTEAGFTLEEVGIAAALLGAVSLAASLVMKSMEGLSGLSAGGIGKVLIGLAAITAVVWALSEIGINIVESLQEVKIDPEIVNAYTSMLESLAIVFLIMVPVLLASVIVGAAATFALPFMLAGFAALGVATYSLSEVAMTIIKDLNKLDVSDDIGPKADVFVKVMSSIGSLIDSIASIMELMTPGLGDIIQGTSFAKKINKATEFIEMLIGERGGNGIIGIVEVVINAIKDLNVEGMGEAAGVFSGVLGSVGELAKALTPSPEFFKATEAMFGPSVPELVDGVNETMKTMTGSLRQLIRYSIDAVSGMLEQPLPPPEKIQAIGGLFSGIASLLQAISPNPEVINAFKVTDKDGNQKLDIEGVTQFFKEYLPRIRSLVSTLAGGLIEDLLYYVKDVPVDKLNAMGSIGEILKAVGDLSSAINQGAKVPSVKIDKGAVGNVVNITSNAPTLTEILREIGPLFGSLVEGVQRVADTMPSGKAGETFDKKVKTVVGLFNLLKAVPELAAAVRSLDETKDSKGNIVIKEFDMGDAILRITQIMGSMIEGPNGGYLPPLMNKVEKVYDFLTKGRSTSLSKITGKLTTFFENLKKLSDSFTGLRDFGAKINTVKADEPTFQEGLSSGMSALDVILGKGNGGIGQSVENIVGHIDSLGDSLGKTNSTKMMERLAKFSESLANAASSIESIIKIDTAGFSGAPEKFSSIALALGGLTKGFVGEDGKNQLSELTTALKNIDYATLNSAISDFDKLAGSLVKVQRSFAKVESAMSKGVAQGTMDAVTNLVRSINSMNEALAPDQLGTVNIKTRLKSLAENMGVGGKNDLVIKNKQLQINLEVHVEMLASELERAILIRKKSIIRDYINLLAGGEQGGEKTKVASAIPHEGNPPPFPATTASGLPRTFGLQASGATPEV
jgi:hypothetical protein